MAHLKWSKNEVERVVNAAVQLRVDEPLLTRLDALYRAQGAVLEPHRRKPKIDYAFEKKLLGMLDSAPPPAPKVIVAPPPPPPPSPQEILTDFLRPFFDALGDAIVSKLAPVLGEAIAQSKVSVERAVEQAHVAPADATAAPHAARKRVVVIAANADQRREIERSFPGLRFDFCDNGAKGEKVAHLAEGADLVIGMTKFMRHHAEKNVKALRHYVRVNGGVSSIKTVIHSRLNGSIAAS